jgi:signal transduction histidine kinase/FixJ family two-component response regulator
MSDTLLLVDDEEGIRKFLGLLLRDMGYEVTTAANGDEAMRLVADAAPDIVLTDIKMPGMDGIELLRRIKAHAPEIEVVMISGHGDMELAIASLQLEAADFVTKPVNDEILAATLRRVSEKLAMKRQIKSYTENLEEMVREKSARVLELERELAATSVVDAVCRGMHSLGAESLPEGVFNNLPCLMAVHNRDLEVVTCNQLYLERVGDKVGGSSLEAYQTEAGQDNPVQRTFETGRGQRARATFRDPAGAPLPMEVFTSPVSHRDGQVELVLEMALDMSELSRLREELRVAQEKYQDLFEQTPCYIAVRDRDYRIVANNRRFAQDFGEGAGRFCYEAFKHRSDPCPDCSSKETFVDGQSHPHEAVVTTLDGRKLHALSWSAPIRDARGEVVEVMEMSTDITQIRQLQDHLTSLGLMLGSMSHGVKGMLTALEGGVYRLESGLKRQDLARIADAAESVKQLTGRIKTLVLNVLYYAKSRDLATEAADLAGFCRQVAQVVAPKAERERIAFTTDIAPDLGRFSADLANLSAALVNILENAIDACVADHAKPEHRIGFAVRAADGFVDIEITDNGMGMDQETREKALTLFFSSKGLRGTGLGLFIANDVIAKHQGALTLESEPGQGTRFRIRLPRTPPAA